MRNALHAGDASQLAGSIRIELTRHTKRLRSGLDLEQARDEARWFCRFVLNSGMLHMVRSVLWTMDEFEATHYCPNKLESELRELLRSVSGKNVYQGRAVSCDMGARLLAIEENLSLLAGYVSRVFYDGQHDTSTMASARKAAGGKRQNTARRYSEPVQRSRRGALAGNGSGGRMDWSIGDGARSRTPLKAI
jgi:hypothetical protein